MSSKAKSLFWSFFPNLFYVFRFKSAYSLPLPVSSARSQNSAPPIIEIIMNQYAHLKCANLAQGVAHWSPPKKIECITKEKENLVDKYCKYGPSLGDFELRQAIAKKLQLRNNLSLEGQEVMVTAGGNQAFVNAALALCDPGDKVVLITPYYFSHLVALQLAGASVSFANFDPETMLPDMSHLSRLVQPGCKMVVLNTPNNPSGAVVPEKTIIQIVEMCKRVGAWFVIDEAYEHFTFDGSKHFSPCGIRLKYDGIIHLFTMSKSYGLAGWRVGYMMYPSRVSNDMQKIQDTIPTHATMKSQAIALACIEPSNDENEEVDGDEWVAQQVSSLERCRDAMWEAVKNTGTVKTNGSFYFLVKLPAGTDDMKVVDFLATKHGVMVLPGSAFGAPGHLRVSYGSLPEKRCLEAISRFNEGIKAVFTAKLMQF